MKKKYSKAIKNIAAQEGVCPEFVYTEIQKAIAEGYNNPDPEVQAYWQKIAPNGELPTPERLIELLTKEIKSNNNSI